jgi:hypothetical protein
MEPIIHFILRYDFEGLAAGLEELRNINHTEGI